MPGSVSDEDETQSDTQKNVEDSKSGIYVKNPNNNFTRLLSSSTFFYLFMSIVLVIVVWWITYMVSNGNK